MGKVAETNLLSMEFWRKLKEKWYTLSDAGKKKYLAASIELTLNAWAYATEGTGLAAPLKYADFEFNVSHGEETAIVHSANMLYGKLEKKCKEPWEAVAVKQIMLQLCNQYKLRDTGQW